MHCILPLHANHSHPSSCTFILQAVAEVLVADGVESALKS